jgi:hypothetical protein
MLLLLFMQRNMVREGTAFLLDALAGDKPEEGPLQTKLLEINLVTNPQVRLSALICLAVLGWHCSWLPVPDTAGDQPGHKPTGAQCCYCATMFLSACFTDLLLGSGLCAMYLVTVSYQCPLLACQLGHKLTRVWDALLCSAMFCLHGWRLAVFCSHQTYSSSQDLCLPTVSLYRHHTR